MHNELITILTEKNYVLINAGLPLDNVLEVFRQQKQDVKACHFVYIHIMDQFNHEKKEILINEQLDCLPDYVCYDVRGIIKEYLL